MSALRTLGLAVALAVASASLSACTLTRTRVGSPLPAELPALTPGVVDMADVLAQLGAPTRISRGPSGHIFVYLHRRIHSDTFTIEEPVVTNLVLFSYTDRDEREDRLVVLFDADGKVLGSGVHRGVPELDD